MSEMSKEDVAKKVLEYTVALRQSGKTDSEIEQILTEQGIDKEGARTIVNATKNTSYQYGEQESDSGGMGWLIWILILVGVNVCSAIFDWPFWIY